MTPRGRYRLLAIVAGMAAGIALAVYVLSALWNVCAVLYAPGSMPLLGLLATAVTGLWRLVMPFMFPVIVFLIICTVLSAVHQLYTESRRYGALSWGGRVDVVFSAVRRVAGGVAAHLPGIVMVVVIAAALNTVLLGIGQLNTLAENARRIKELTAVLKNLSRVEDVAQVTLLSQADGEDGVPVKTYLVEVLSNDGGVTSEQTVELRGEQMYIDCMTISFEYSEIESGAERNLAYPYRVYSERMRPDDGIPLTCVFDGGEVPVMYYLENSDIYGISPSAFLNRIQELFALLKDEDASRELGIRSANGEAPHFVMSPGDVHRIRVEGSGGLSVRPKTRIGSGSGTLGFADGSRQTASESAAPAEQSASGQADAGQASAEDSEPQGGMLGTLSGAAGTAVDALGGAAGSALDAVKGFLPFSRGKD